MKKIISLLLTLCLLLSLASVAVAEFTAKLGDGVVTLHAKKAVMYVIAKGDDKYHYAAKAGETVVLPLQSGPGTYSITEYKPIGGNKYKKVSSKKVRFSGDELAPFKVPSSIVPFAPEAKAVLKAVELTAGLEDDAEKVEAIYEFVCSGFDYDYFKAFEVKGSARYVVDVDDVMESRRGICYDLSTLMVSMIRSIGVPARLEIGNEHAWLRVFVDEQWKLIDPAYKIQTGKAKDPRFKYEPEEIY